MKWTDLFASNKGKAVELLFEEVERRLSDLVAQFNTGDQTDDALKLTLEASRAAKTKTPRLLLFNSLYALSFKIDGDDVRAYLLRTAELVHLTEIETTINLRMILQAGIRDGQQTILLDGEIEVDEEHLRVLLLSLVEDMVRKSAQMSATSNTSPRLAVDGRSISTAVRELVHDKHKLLNDLLSQNEIIQGAIARELHDDVISDLMFAKKQLAGGAGADSCIPIIDEAVTKLRNICSGLSARDLQDWGLIATLEDMLQKLGGKTGVVPKLEKNGDLPSFPHSVQLQIYRIIQEALNNAVKHSGAKEVAVSIACSGGEIVFAVIDDGRGIAENREHRGTGLRIMQERASIIDMDYPASLAVQGAKPQGTQVTLRILTTPRQP